MGESPILNRFCLDCGYNLRGLIAPRCPECGKAFDPNDPKTWSPRPLGEQKAHLVVDAAGSMFYWGCAVPVFLLFVALMFYIMIVLLAPHVRKMFE